MKTLTKLIVALLPTVYCLLPLFGISQTNNNASLQPVFAQSYSFEYKGEYKQAVDILQKNYNDKSYEINLRMGWLYYLAGSFTEAVTYYQKAISIMPYSIEARLGYINPAAKLGHADMVTNQYLEILKIDPKQTTANYQLGLTYYYKADYIKAQKYFETVVNLYPFDYDSVIMLGWTNLKSGKMNEAKVLFQKALLIRPSDKSATDGLGMIK